MFLDRVVFLVSILQVAHGEVRIGLFTRSQGVRFPAVHSTSAARSVIDCCRQCQEDGDCRAVNFRSGGSDCQLVKDVDGVSPVTDPGWTMYRMQNKVTTSTTAGTTTPSTGAASSAARTTPPITVPSTTASSAGAVSTTTETKTTTSSARTTPPTTGPSATTSSAGAASTTTATATATSSARTTPPTTGPSATTSSAGAASTTTATATATSSARTTPPTTGPSTTASSARTTVTTANAATTNPSADTTSSTSSSTTTTTITTGPPTTDYSANTPATITEIATTPSSAGYYKNNFFCKSCVNTEICASQQKYQNISQLECDKVGMTLAQKEKSDGTTLLAALRSCQLPLPDVNGQSEYLINGTGDGDTSSPNCKRTYVLQQEIQHTRRYFIDKMPCDYVGACPYLCEKELLQTSTTPSAKCIPGWTHFNASCYIAQGDMKTWAEAQKSCMNLYPGATLTDVTSATEQTFLELIINQMCSQATSSATSSAVWIAGCNAGNGRFVWQPSGKPMMSGYNNFQINQPGDSGGDCVSIRITDGFHWHDSDCSVGYQSVCKYRL